MKRLALIAVALAAAAGASLCAASNAAARPNAGYCYSGGFSVSVFGRSLDAAYCSVWDAPVPVRSSLAARYPTVGRHGYLYSAGYANWFVCQVVGSWVSFDGYSSDWWAYTQADNGRWGYVNETRFSGPWDEADPQVLPACPNLLPLS